MRDGKRDGTGGGNGVKRDGKDLVPRSAYRLPDALRAELARPFGPVVQTDGVRAAVAGASFVVAVGDVVSLTLLEVGVTPRFYVCDYHTQRGQAPLGAGPAKESGPPPASPRPEESRAQAAIPREPQPGPPEPKPLDPSLQLRTRLHQWGSRELRTRNPAAHVTREAWETIRAAMADEGPAPLRIVVQGEEDLLGIPCFLEAPVGAVVLYGMPGQGVVVVRITPAIHALAEGIVARMELE